MKYPVKITSIIADIIDTSTNDGIDSLINISHIQFTIHLPITKQMTGTCKGEIDWRTEPDINTIKETINNLFQ